MSTKYDFSSQSRIKNLSLFFKFFNKVVNDTTGAATLGNEDGLGEDMTATRRDDDSSVTGRDEEAPRVPRPLPNIVIEVNVCFR